MPKTTKNDPKRGTEEIAKQATEEIKEPATKKGTKFATKHATKLATKKGTTLATRLATKNGTEEVAKQLTKNITKGARKLGTKTDRKTVKLRRGPTCPDEGDYKLFNKRYNEFEIEYTITEKVEENTGKVVKQESERTLVHPYLLGLNPEVLSRHPPAGWIQKKEKIWNFLPKFQYWGHMLQHSIEEFNKKYTTRYRTLRYVLRHAQADHNAWKTGFKNQGQPEEWKRVTSIPSHHCHHES